MTRIDFYVLAGAAEEARLRTACRIAEKAYAAGQRALVLCPDERTLASLDEMLWTFADRSFVPHEPATSPDRPCESPVILSLGTLPPGPREVLLNLSPEVPAFFAEFARIAEIVDGEPARRAAGRARFRVYRERGFEPLTHDLQGEPQPA